MEATTLDLCRRHTAGEHQKLETLLGALEQKFSLHDYRHMLAHFYGFQAPFVALLQQMTDHPQVVTFVQGHDNVERLARDLAYLGWPATRLPWAILRRDFWRATPAHLWGYAYVMAGSMLGGMQMRRHFAQKFSLTEAGGLAYFSACGPEAARRWGQFKDHLNSLRPPLVCPEDVARGAAHAFAALRQWCSYDLGGVL